MRTVLIRGDAPVPPALRELVERGSTSFDERQASALGDASPFDADRIVFWTAVEDPAVERLAEKYATRESAERREIVVFVTTPRGPSAVIGVPANEMYVWPRDEDRLKMAFLTGA